MIKNAMYNQRSGYELKLLQAKFDSLEKVIPHLRETQRSSPTMGFVINIRFRAKLASQYPLTYTSTIEYYCDNENYKIIAFGFDGVEGLIRQ